MLSLPRYLIRKLCFRIFQTDVIFGFVHCIGCISAFSGDFIAIFVPLFFCQSRERQDTVLADLVFPLVSDCGFNFLNRSEKLLTFALLFFLCLSFTFICSISVLIVSRTACVPCCITRRNIGGWKVNRTIRIPRL